MNSIEEKFTKLLQLYQNSYEDNQDAIALDTLVAKLQNSKKSEKMCVEMAEVSLSCHSSSLKTLIRTTEVECLTLVENLVKLASFKPTNTLIEQTELQLRQSWRWYFTEERSTIK